MIMRSLTEREDLLDGFLATACEFFARPERRAEQVPSERDRPRGHSAHSLGTNELVRGADLDRIRMITTSRGTAPRRLRARAPKHKAFLRVLIAYPAKAFAAAGATGWPSRLGTATRHMTSDLDV
jgi:hypothetical protein